MSRQHIKMLRQKKSGIPPSSRSEKSPILNPLSIQKLKKLPIQLHNPCQCDCSPTVYHILLFKLIYSYHLDSFIRIEKDRYHQILCIFTPDYGKTYYFNSDYGHALLRNAHCHLRTGL